MLHLPQGLMTLITIECVTVGNFLLCYVFLFCNIFFVYFVCVCILWAKDNLGSQFSPFSMWVVGSGLSSVRVGSERL